MMTSSRPLLLISLLSSASTIAADAPAKGYEDHAERPYSTQDQMQRLLHHLHVHSTAEEVIAAIKAGASVHGRDQADSTPTILAASKGLLEVVKMLLERGADASSKENNSSDGAATGASNTRVPWAVASGGGGAEASSSATAAASDCSATGASR